MGLDKVAVDTYAHTLRGEYDAYINTYKGQNQLANYSVYFTVLLSYSF